MADDFDPAEIAEMIAEEGQSVTLVITVPDEYVPGSGHATGTPDDVTTVGVLLPFSRGLRALPESGIDSRDQQLLLPATIDKPSLDTKVLIGVEPFAIVEVNTLAPKGVDLYYDCTVRGTS